MWHHSEKVLSWMGTNTGLIAVARVLISVFRSIECMSPGFQIPVLRLQCKSINCCSIMKMQSCFSQLLHELEMTSSSTVLLLDSTLKCILQHTLWGFYWFIMSMFNFLTLVQCDKWRALGSEILFINNSLQWILSTPILPGCLKRTTLLSKKVVPCNKRVHPSQMRFLC